MRNRRLKSHPAALEVSAFINLIVVLVPFLLSTAVFTRLSVLDLKLPAQNSPNSETTQVGKLLLEVIIRKDALDVDDRNGGRLLHIPDVDGQHDIPTLAAEMLLLKNQHADTTEATVLAESNTPYDTLVKVMDAMRATKVPQGNQAVDMELFPAISIGDAPVTTAEFAAAHPNSAEAKALLAPAVPTPAAPPAKKR
jgi:biopolymer transport protein ExbD